MQLIKSLFCIKGLDNSERFLAVAIACIAMFLFINGVLATGLLFKFFAILVLSVVFFTSSLRRCRDAHRRSLSAWLVSALFVVNQIIIVSIEHSTSYSLLIPLIAMVLYVFSMSSSAPQVYVMGYNGPVDLTVLAEPVNVARKPVGNRIEPSLFGTEQSTEQNEFTTAPESNIEQQKTHKPRLAHNDLAAAIERFIKNKTGTVNIAISITIVVALIVSLFPLIGAALNEESVSGEAEPTETVTVQATDRQHLLAMPDDFYLLLDQNKGLIIHWKADAIGNGEVWSQATAKGDDSCKVIEFNNGDKVRTINVVAEDAGSYYANFSPLDSASIVKSLARRGNFGLCGYNFSLKGSQKALNSNPAYIDWAN